MERLLNNLLIALSIIVTLGLAISMGSCEKANQVPTCKITVPTNGQEIAKGEIVIISVEASDSDGNIAEVRFFIDGVEKSSAKSYPYKYEWHTGNESIGSRLLKATSVDNSGDSNSDEITVVIIDGGGIGTFTDPRDGQTYNTVEIGSQEWFAENLNYETSNSWWYDNSSANGDVYGRLYTWEAALTACPSGWHLPSDEEWKTLEMFLGMSQSQADDIVSRGTDEGKKLKSTYGWNSNGNGTDAVGFKALPGGVRTISGQFGYLDFYGTWWSATAHASTSAWYRDLSYYTDKVLRYDDNKEVGFSVRCLRD